MTVPKPHLISQPPIQKRPAPGSGAALDVDSNMPQDGVVEIHDDDEDRLEQDREQ